MKTQIVAALCAVLVLAGCDHETTKKIALVAGHAFCFSPPSGLAQVLTTPQQVDAGKVVCAAVVAAASTADNGDTQ